MRQAVECSAVVVRDDATPLDLQNSGRYVAVQRGYRLGFFAILAIVFLRWAVGWHFFDEGMKKYRDPDFSAEPFLLQAKGPLAPYFHAEAPGFHDWRNQLATPRQADALSAEEADALAAWRDDFKKRTDEAKKANEPLPVELPPVAVYQPWAGAILRDWGETRTRFEAAADLDEGQSQQAAEALREHTQRLADYFSDHASAIADYRHELYRAAKMEDAPQAGELPYFDERIEEMQADVRGAPTAWIVDIRAIESSYLNALREIAASGNGQGDEKLSEPEAARVETALRQDDSLSRVNRAATWLTLGVGVLLLLGFFTRLASLAGALFLLAVIATQPPWVAGAMPIYNQVIEFFALCVLFAVGAGRWLGLDFISYSIWSMLRGDENE